MVSVKKWALALLCGLVAPGFGHAQQLDNDGFQRRNGQMQVVRNGHARPMTHDAHLPSGAVVTKDGFVVAATGQRTELREGQGCDLRGRPVAVRTAADGRVALAPPAAVVVANPAGPGSSRSLLEEIFGSRGDEDCGYYKFKKGKKHHGKGRGRWKDDDD